MNKVKEPEEHEATMLFMAKERFEDKYGYLPVKVMRQENGLGAILLLLGPIGECGDG